MDKTAVYAFLSALVGSGLVLFLAREILSKGIQHAFDRECKKFEAELKRDSDQRMEELRNRFEMGATSHMADVAFDKYVEFCEEYVKSAQDTFTIVFGPGIREDKISEHARKLRSIDIKWAIWTTSNLQEQLARFEHALFRIASIQQQLRDLPHPPNRQDLIAELIELQTRIFGWDKGTIGEKVPSDVSIGAVIEALKEVLGTNKLNQLRADLVDQASKRARSGAEGGN